MRTLAAFFTAPLTIVAAIALMDPAAWGFGVFLTIFYGYPAMLLVGLPSYFYLKKRGRLTLSKAVAAGAGLGAILPAIILLVPPPGTQQSQSTARAMSSSLKLTALGLVLGALSALVFWLIAVGPRRTCNTSPFPHDKSLERRREE